MEKIDISSYLKLIDNKLSKKNNKIIKYDKRVFDVEKLCGPVISETCDIEFLQSIYNDKDYIVLICINNKDEILGFFVGGIEVTDNKLESNYTCAKSGSGCGEILRYYGFLMIYDIYPNIKIMTGSATGGIPAINDSMSVKEKDNANYKLKEYHLKRGASLTNDIFIYTWDTVIQRIQLWLERGGKKISKKSKKRSYRKRI